MPVKEDSVFTGLHRKSEGLSGWIVVDVERKFGSKTPSLKLETALTNTVISSKPRTPVPGPSQACQADCVNGGLPKSLVQDATINASSRGFASDLDCARSEPFSDSSKHVLVAEDISLTPHRHISTDHTENDDTRYFERVHAASQ